MIATAALSRIDLHLHTTASDGTLTPEELVTAAARRGVSVIGLTDHDITDGLALAEPAARRLGVELVAGVEINTDWKGSEVHLLGYFTEVFNPGLQEELKRLRQGREERNRKILARLRALGHGLDPRRVAEIAGEGSVGRPHIAAALVEAGQIESMGEAFRRLLTPGKPAYVPRYRITPAQAVAIVLEAGGVPVLAHPAKLRDESLIKPLVDAGLLGLEAYHCDHTPAATAHYLDLARRYGLLVTGGTDSHGPRSERPVEIGSVAVPEEVWPRLEEAMQNQRPAS